MDNLSLVQHLLAEIFPEHTKSSNDTPAVPRPAIILQSSVINPDQLTTTVRLSATTFNSTIAIILLLHHLLKIPSGFLWKSSHLYLLCRATSSNAIFAHRAGTFYMLMLLSYQPPVTVNDLLA